MQNHILNDLISIKTDGDAVNYQKCIKYIKEYIRRTSPHGIIKSISTNGFCNLIIGLNVSDLRDIHKGLMLCGHLDVVSGKKQQFSPVIKENKIYGRGATDMKGAIACYLEMIPYFDTLKLPVILCLTCDEETNMQGIKGVCAFLDENNIKPQLTILGEPTNNKLGISSTGIRSYKTIIRGVAAHSSVLDKGVNALFVAAKILQSLEKISQKMIQKVYLNVGSVYGGGNIAVIPDKAEIEWGFRYTKEADVKKVIRLYDKALALINKQYPATRIETIMTDEFLGYCATDKTQTQMLCENLKIDPMRLSYTSEAGYLAKNGQNVYLFGCGNIEQAHSDNEYIYIDDLMTYKELLRKIALLVSGFDNC